MTKIISLFQRNYDGNRLVRDELVPGAEWVRDGEGIATQKYDGTCCLIQGRKFYRRYEVKPGKTPPEGFLPANEVDENTGKQQGWMEVGDGPQDEWHREARKSVPVNIEGTFELCGPKIQGNPEHFPSHVLIQHGITKLLDAPRTFDALPAYMLAKNIEGIVWHHPDGRMVKIKLKDFGIKRPE